MPRIALLAGLALLGGGLLFAQPAPPRPSAQEMLKQSDRLLDDMKQKFKEVVGLQEVARKQKDVIKLNCVNDKLLQIKQLMNIADAASADMQEAIGRNDEEGRTHEFTRISIAHQQVAVLGTESNDCVGGGELIVGPTQVDVQAPEEPDDPTKPPAPDIPVIELPPMASSFS